MNNFKVKVSGGTSIHINNNAGTGHREQEANRAPVDVPVVVAPPAPVVAVADASSQYDQLLALASGTLIPIYLSIYEGSVVKSVALRNSDGTRSMETILPLNLDVSAREGKWFAFFRNDAGKIKVEIPLQATTFVAFKDRSSKAGSWIKITTRERNYFGNSVENRLQLKVAPRTEHHDAVKVVLILEAYKRLAVVIQKQEKQNGQVIDSLLKKYDKLGRSEKEVDDNLVTLQKALLALFKAAGETDVDVEAAATDFSFNIGIKSGVISSAYQVFNNQVAKKYFNHKKLVKLYGQRKDRFFNCTVPKNPAYQHYTVMLLKTYLCEEGFQLDDDLPLP